MFSLRERQSMITKMGNSAHDNVFDLIVIGGGITGAGVARDAASRGMSVALVEAQDFAQGTSSRSSKLIHGGIRYLENLEFGLVFEALSERRLLFELAPHLVHPLRFVLPLYEGGRVGMFKMGLGMWLYDALSMFEAPEMHERLSPMESLERLPLLQRRQLLGSYVYSDAYMDDDRLVHETLRSAHDLGAMSVNHVRALDAGFENGRVNSIGCGDEVTGQTFRIRGRHVISTVGPWTDTVASTLLGTWKKLLRPSKGVHLTFDRKRLQLNQAVVMAADHEKRIVFGIPRHEMIIVGTTDTDYPGDPAAVGANPDDVRYLLHVANEYFPGARLTAADIICTYAGVRPLVHDGAETESKTSREHVILNDPRNVTFVAGGKYTTYRLMAEQAVKAALENFSVEDQVRFARNNTKVPLNPKATSTKIDEMRRHSSELAREFGFDQKCVSMLIDRHGGEALDLLKMEPSKSTQASAPKTAANIVANARASLANLNSDSDEAYRSDEERMWALELRHAVRNTMCLGLTDFYVRRAPLFLARADHGLPMLATLSRIFAQEAGWSDSRRQSEAAQLQAHLRQELAWQSSFDLASRTI